MEKYYVEDVFRRKVLMAENPNHAAVSFIKMVLHDNINPRDITISLEWLNSVKEYLIFSNEVFVGKKGFVKDLLDLNDQNKEASAHLVKYLLLQTGRSDLAEKMVPENYLENVVKRIFDIQEQLPSCVMNPIYLIMENTVSEQWTLKDLT